jgi:hypothetical protein
MDISVDDHDWPLVVSRIEEAIDLEASVVASGALKRRREVRSGADLLRLALAYGPGGQSLRETAAWAALQQVAELSDAALLYRLRDAADWLGWIAGSLLAQRTGETVALAGYRLRIVDATVISPPGRGGRWRLHAVYDPGIARFTGLGLTNTHGAESLTRVEAEPGELILADRVYARPVGLQRLIDAQVDFVVRMGSRSLTLSKADGSAFDLAAALDQSDRFGACDLTVRIDHKGHPERARVARLVVIRKPTEAARQARDRARNESRRGGHCNDPSSLRAAEHLMLITSLAQDKASPEQLASLYRLRWQIELAFKRLKSLLHLDRLPAKNEGLARAWIFAHLIAALLVEDLCPALRDIPP